MNTHDAKSRLSELIRAVHAGDEVIVARNGEPVAKLIAWPPEREVRRFGALAGKVSSADDLIGSDPDVLADFDAATHD